MPSSMPSRPMPLIGFLCLMAGAGMLYSSRRFAVLIEDLSPYAKNGAGLIGLILILVGIRLAARGFRNRSSSRIGRLNRNRVMLPREGLMYLIIMVVAFIASLIGKNNLLMLVFSLMAGPFILNGGIAFTQLRRTQVRRWLPDRAMAGELISIDITFENQKWWFSAWLMLVRDMVIRKDASGREDVTIEPAVLFASVRARCSRTASYQLRLNQRGRYLFGPMEVSTRFPIGLVERGYIVDAPGELIVHPRLGRLTPRWAGEVRAVSETVQPMQSRRGMFEDEFHHLRNYRPGDSPRSIHWRTSARQQGLMVREYHQTRDRSLIVLLELWQPESPTAADRDRVELAVCFAGTVCVEHLRQNRGVDQHLLISGHHDIQHHSDRGPAAICSVLDVLATAEAGRARGMSMLLDSARQLQDSMTRVVMITTVPGDRQKALDTGVLPGLEIFRTSPEELSQWFVLE